MTKRTPVFPFGAGPVLGERPLDRLTELGRVRGNVALEVLHDFAVGADRLLVEVEFEGLKRDRYKVT